MLLTVSGPPGSGKSTTAEGLAAALELDHVSGGDIFREMAAERDMSLAAFGELAESDDEIDRDLDRRLRQVATDREDLVLESRLAGWLGGENADLRFWLDAPLSVRAARIADREGVTAERARNLTETREASERRRYREYYGIEIGNRRIYDLALNTARWGEEAALTLLLTAVEEHDPDVDEGKMPIADVDLPGP